jgi:hypothetical protein
MEKETPVGLTKDSGYQVGSRRTYDIDQVRAWSALLSARGNELLTGRKVALELEGPGASWTGGPVAYEMASLSPGSHFRMKWRLPGWEKPSILQVRVLRASEGRTTIAFHQERLEDPSARADMLARWESVHARLGELFDINA